MIELKNVFCEYKGGIKALNGVDLTVREGSKVGLIGCNGAGKSSLFRVLTGLMPFEGKVTVGGMELRRDDLPKIRRLIGYVIQESDDQMFMPTVIDDMIFGPVNFGMSREEALKRSEDLLTRLGIYDLKDRPNHRLSGGEKKMAAIASILSCDPSVILFDEPTSSLDPRNRRRVIDLLKGLDKTFIVASHDLDLILDTCDLVVVIDGGRITAEGEPSVILRDRELLGKNGLELPLSLQGTTGI